MEEFITLLIFVFRIAPLLLFILLVPIVAISIYLWKTRDNINKKSILERWLNNE